MAAAEASAMPPYCVSVDGWPKDRVTPVDRASAAHIVAINDKIRLEFIAVRRASDMNSDSLIEFERSVGEIVAFTPAAASSV
jgi:hypothetical protein